MSFNVSANGIWRKESSEGDSFFFFKASRSKKSGNQTSALLFSEGVFSVTWSISAVTQLLGRWHPPSYRGHGRAAVRAVRVAMPCFVGWKPRCSAWLDRRARVHCCASGALALRRENLWPRSWGPVRAGPMLADPGPRPAPSGSTCPKSPAQAFPAGAKEPPHIRPVAPASL